MNKFKEYISNRQVLAIIVSILFLVIGTTFAWFTWNGNSTSLSLTIGDIGEVIYNEGQNINISNMAPVLDYNDGESTSFYVKKITGGIVDIKIEITPTMLPINLKNDSFKCKLMKSNNNTTWTEINEINFTEKIEDEKFTLGVDSLFNGTTYYKIVFYIDGNMLNVIDMQGQTFEAIIEVSAEGIMYRDASNANPPVLADGMIPVMYDTVQNSWVKADYYDSTSAYAGYDYQNKKWANAVMVTSATRDTYMNTSVGTPVLESDILAYFVWIPRYKYELFNPTYTSGTSPQLIDVEFELETSTTGTVICTYDELGNESCTNKTVGNYYTHPAFTLGNTKLTGIWIGKFETTGTADTPTIKPNLLGIRNQAVSVCYTTSQKFGTIDYLISEGVDKVDSHMMKNIEWGAVAYLKQSIYGLGILEIYPNNSGSSSTETYTGRSGGNVDASSITNGTYSYDGRTCLTASCITEEINAISLGTGASTTGNITGVYDMSGGKWEYVMGNCAKTPSSSGLSLISIGTQYYDLYSGTDFSYSHLGDALGETTSWYGDYSTFVNRSNPWFRRGGQAVGSASRGSFSYARWHGAATTDDGFRSVIAPV